MQVAIENAIARTKGREPRNAPLDLYRLVETLVYIIVGRHDFGRWSKSTFDGLCGGHLIATDLTKTTMTVSLVLATFEAKGFGCVPLMLQLEAENGTLKYNLAMERIKVSEYDLNPDKLWKHLYLLSHGDFHRDWHWGYQVKGYI